MSRFFTFLEGLITFTGLHNNSSRKQDPPFVDMSKSELATPEGMKQEDNLATVAVLQNDELHSREYPKDGLRAWSVVAGACCSMICTFGATTSFGVYQSYYKNTLFPHMSASQISWISGIQYFLLFALGLPTGILVAKGYTRRLLCTGSVIICVAQLSLSWCTAYWSLVLVQGFIFGCGSGMVFSPSCAAVPGWFDKRTNLALGVIACGSAAGGTIFSLVASVTLRSMGFAWSCRLLSLISLVLLSGSCLLVRPYPIAAGAHVNDWSSAFGALKKMRFVTYLAGVFLASAGVYLPINYMEEYTVRIGLTESYLQYIVTIINAVSIVGRLGGGYLADIISPILIMAVSTAACGIMSIFWNRCGTGPSVLVISCLFGTFQGAYVALLPAGAYAIQPKHPGPVLGIMFTMVSVATLISQGSFGALITPEQNSGAYSKAVILAATVLLASALCLLYSAWLLRRTQRRHT